jgi:hypothetical protein
MSITGETQSIQRLQLRIAGNSWPRMDSFICSRGEIIFVSSVHISRRVPHQMVSWKNLVDKMTQIVNTEDRDPVLDCHETDWKLYPNGTLTWGPGTQNVAISIIGNRQKAWLVRTGFRFVGQQLPLDIMAKGETSRFEATYRGWKKSWPPRPISLDIKLFTELMSSVWIILPIVSNDPS